MAVDIIARGLAARPLGLLYSPSSNVIEQRNGTAAQRRRVYNTYTDDSNYERVALGWSGNEFQIVTENAGTGSGSRNIVVSAGGQVQLWSNGALRALFGSTGVMGFSGLSSSTVGLLRNGTVLETKLGDNSAYAQFAALSFKQGSAGPVWSSGTGTPEGAVTAPVGSLFSRTDGGASTSLYVKESGAGNTGWIAK